MKILREGHRYELAAYEGGEPQVVQFIEKVPAIGPDRPMVTMRDGTTNEEVLLMLIDRLNSLNEKFPCRENSLAITRCEEALMWLTYRTAGRRVRGVEGQHKP